MVLEHNLRFRSARVLTQDIYKLHTVVWKRLHWPCTCKFSTSVFSQAYINVHKACWPKTSLQHRISFDVGMMRVQSLDLATSPVQTMPSCHALNFAWEEHWACGHLHGRLQYTTVYTTAAASQAHVVMCTESYEVCHNILCRCVCSMYWHQNLNYMYPRGLDARTNFQETCLKAVS